MKLTIEDHGERIKRFGHIKPAPFWGSALCSVKCPGTLRTCTLARGHSGPHVAHGMFRRVLAVWDGGTDPRARKTEKRTKREVGAVPRNGFRNGGVIRGLGAYLARIIRNPPSVEEAFLLILALGMAGFAIHWALLILGLR